MPFKLFKKNTEPISRQFGFDRGLPIDRYYIEKFLGENSGLVRGSVLEIGNSDYSKKFGKDVKSFNILNFEDGKDVTIVGDLSKPETLPKDIADCFICTQTFNFIYDLKTAVRGTKILLKENGVLLATVAGISQISRYDMDRWGDYWRFTTLSAKKLFEEEFGAGNVKVDFYGNYLSVCSFLKGMASHEISKEGLDHKDQDYQLLITIVARKNETS